MIDIKQLTQQKNELKDVWDYLGIDTPFPDKQVRQWLLEFDVDEIGSAFQVLAKREDIVNDTVAYIGKVLRNAKLMNMTVEEREAKVSALRSLAGAIGARRKHEAEMKAIREGFARNLPQVCQKLPEVSQPFASEKGLEVEVGFGGERVSEQEREQELKAATPPAPSALCSTAKEEKQKTKPKPEPTQKTNNGVGVSANRDQKQNQKPKIIKTAMGDRPKPQGFDSWTNTERVEWMNCTCGAEMKQEPDGFRYFVHNGACAVDNGGNVKAHKPAVRYATPYTKAAAAPQSNHSPLGNVDEL
jgi:hypothetical protein